MVPSIVRKKTKEGRFKIKEGKTKIRASFRAANGFVASMEKKGKSDFVVVKTAGKGMRSKH